MSNLSVELKPATAILEFGEILRVDDSLRVCARSGIFPVRRAVSCLVEPVEGDKVTVAIESLECAYVLAVLERKAGIATKVVFDNDVELHAPDGRMTLCARDSVSLASPGTVELTSRKLEVNAMEAGIAIDNTTVSGSWLRACVDNINLVANAFDASLDRWTQRVRQSLRRVAELDEVKAGQIDYAASETMALHGRNTLMTAKKLVKLDGDQIHLG